jgi:dolichyl-phosphate-mannose--protein O-mannosyl transferase
MTGVTTPDRPSLAAGLAARVRAADAGGWLTTLAVTCVAAAARLPHLGRPPSLVFDETFYVKDAWTLLNQGYESQWPDDFDASFEAGDVYGYLDEPSYVVHPPVGKWVIAAGMRLLGAQDPVGWRLGVAVAGLLTVLLVVRIARRLLSSTALGAVAGLVVALDGSAIATSRTALLDGVLTFWMVAAFAALLRDRDRALHQPDAATGRWQRLRPWRLAAGGLLGLAVATKWSGIWFVVAFGLFTVAWDAGVRRRDGESRWWARALLRDAPPAFVAIVVVATATYLASWFSWFRSSAAWGRQWAANAPETWVPSALRSLWHYHQQMWQFHTSLSAEHPYAANPAGWLVQWRPTSFFYASSEADGVTCDAEQCSQTITSLGNPLIWWLATAAVVAAVWWAVRRRDGVVVAALAGLGAGWLPWFAYPDRPTFTFYDVLVLPWLAIILAWAVGALLAWSRDDSVRRARVIAVLVVAAVAVVAVSLFFLPVWTAQPIPFRQWQLRQWFPSWI